MINQEHVRNFCCEEPSLIENYDLASADTTQTWHIHHRLEIVGNSTKSVRELKDAGLYYKRPANELIFLTKSKHHSLHKSGNSNTWYGKHHTEEARKKMAEQRKGRKPMLGKHHTEGTKKKMSENNPRYWKGKKLSGEARKKISESRKGKDIKISDKTRQKMNVTNKKKSSMFSEYKANGGVLSWNEWQRQWRNYYEL